MKYIFILLLVALTMMGLQSRYYRGQTVKQYNKAIAALPDNPSGGFDAIAVTFDYSGFFTLGLAKQMQSQFFQMMRDRTIAKTSSTVPGQLDWPVVLIAALRIFDKAKHDPKLSDSVKEPFDEFMRDLVKAAISGGEKMKETASLSRWDFMITRLGEVSRNSTIPVEGMQEEFDDWLRQLRTTDRRVIGLNDAKRTALEEFREGIKSLGLVPSDTSSDPLIAPIKKKQADQWLFDADRHFSRAEVACRRFANEFEKGALPPELKAIYHKSVFNHAAIRVAHLIDYGYAKLLDEASMYVIDLYVSFANDTIPSDAEIVAEFVKTTTDQLQEVNKALMTDIGAFGEDGLALKALVNWTLVGFWNTINRRDHSQKAREQYQADQSTLAESPEGTKLISILNGADYPHVILK